MSQTPWVIVLGTGPGGSVEFIGGPAGPQGPAGVAGANGAVGPVGPIAAPLAKYLLDTADAGLINGIAIHRALGPDRAPVVANAMDDEMLDPTTGYNSSLWTPQSTGAETYGFDQYGGLVIQTANDSTLRTIEQPFDHTSNYGFTAKVAVGVPGSASNSHVGIYVRDSSNNNFCLLFASLASGNFQFNVFQFSNNTTYVSNPGSFAFPSGATQFVYLRMRGNNTNNPICEWSMDGIAWRVIGGTNFANTATRIGIAVYQGDSNVGKMFVQWFRRTT